MDSISIGYFSSSDTSFQKYYTTTNPNIDEGLYYILPTIIFEEDNGSLTRIPSFKEVHDTLRSMENWSDPGPEGFQAGFHKI